jgi:hypothetical protein
MPIRLCLCLLIACTSASVAARDVKFSSPNSGACPEQSAQTIVPAKEKLRPSATTAPVRESKPRPTLYNDAPARPSLRWHSFLPGMFR